MIAETLQGLDNLQRSKRHAFNSFGHIGRMAFTHCVNVGPKIFKAGWVVENLIVRCCFHRVPLPVLFHHPKNKTVEDPSRINKLGGR